MTEERTLWSTLKERLTDSILGEHCRPGALLLAPLAVAIPAPSTKEGSKGTVHLLFAGADDRKPIPPLLPVCGYACLEWPSCRKVAVMRVDDLLEPAELRVERSCLAEEEFVNAVELALDRGDSPPQPPAALRDLYRAVAQRFGFRFHRGFLPGRPHSVWQLEADEALKAAQVAAGAARAATPVQETSAGAAEPAGTPDTEQRREQDILDLLKKANEIQNQPKDFKVDLRIEGGKDNYKLGENIRFVFKTTKDCYLTLISISSKGKPVIIFPNKWTESSWVTAGTEYRLPPAGSGFSFKAQEPLGVEVVKAIASTQPIKVIDTADVNAAGAFRELKNPEFVMTGIGVEMETRDKKEWSTSDVSFNVEASSEPKKE